jgi:hypothetical protein
MYVYVCLCTYVIWFTRRVAIFAFEEQNTHNGRIDVGSNVCSGSTGLKAQLECLCQTRSARTENRAPSCCFFICKRRPSHWSSNQTRLQVIYFHSWMCEAFSKHRLSSLIAQARSPFKPFLLQLSITFCECVCTVYFKVLKVTAVYLFLRPPDFSKYAPPAGLTLHTIIGMYLICRYKYVHKILLLSE